MGGADVSELESLRKEKNCKVLVNEKPPHKGVLNSNLQSISTLNGIREAKKSGCQYVLKTRGDWRIYAKGALRFMYHLLEEFPCNNSVFLQNKRIISIDIATEETSIMFYPYWISDLLMFGDIDDMYEYWNSTLNEEDSYDKQFVDNLIRSKNYSWKKRVEEGLLNEARYPMDYIKRKTGKLPNITVKSYWNYLQDYFMIVPKSLLNAYWFKYDYRRFDESADWGTCFKRDNQAELLTYNFDFVSWFNLYCDDFPYKEEFEKTAEQRHYMYK